MKLPGRHLSEETPLYIRLDRSATDRVRETLQAIDAGKIENIEPYFEHIFHDPDPIYRIIRPKNLELLQTIAREEPSSVRETAQIVNQDYQDIHCDLSELDDLGMIDLED